MLSGIGLNELLIILVIVLILFGAGRLPSVFGQFGKGIKAFRDAQKEEKEEDAIDVTTPDDGKPKKLPEPKGDLAEEVREKDEVKEKESRSAK